MPSEASSPDEAILALFEGAGPLDTPTPGVRAWLAKDASDSGRAVLIKRVAVTQGKAKATQALALLHPNIVRTRRWLHEGNGLYVVRDVVRGKNLRNSLLGANATARPGPEVLRTLLLPVLDALEYAHAAGLAHGGVSPENIFVADDGAILVTDWATTNPSAPQHVGAYSGVASVTGDVKALGGVLSAYLPTVGAFASPVVRGRIAGVISRCGTLADLRETVQTLEKLAAAPVARNSDSPPAGNAAPPAAATPEAGPASWAQRPGKPFASDPPPLRAAPLLTTQVLERLPRIPQGGGGSVTLMVRNEGNAPLIVRMVATQHPWLNVRPMNLPLTIAPGAAEKVEFFLSAARLTAGDYRSEVYLSANAGGTTAEDLRGGWFKHTSEIRLTVEPPGRPGGIARGPAELPYPADSPRLPPLGCGGATTVLLIALLCAGAARSQSVTFSHFCPKAPFPQMGASPDARMQHNDTAVVTRRVLLP